MWKSWHLSDRPTAVAVDGASNRNRSSRSTSSRLHTTRLRSKSSALQFQVPIMYSRHISNSQSDEKYEPFEILRHSLFWRATQCQWQYKKRTQFYWRVFSLFPFLYYFLLLSFSLSLLYNIFFLHIKSRNLLENAVRLILHQLETTNI